MAKPHPQPDAETTPAPTSAVAAVDAPARILASLRPIDRRFLLGEASLEELAADLPAQAPDVTTYARGLALVFAREAPPELYRPNEDDDDTPHALISAAEYFRWIETGEASPDVAALVQAREAGEVLKVHLMRHDGTTWPSALGQLRSA